MASHRSRSPFAQLGGKALCPNMAGTRRRVKPKSSLHVAEKFRGKNLISERPKRRKVYRGHTYEAKPRSVSGSEGRAKREKCRTPGDSRREEMVEGLGCHRFALG
jgi:hypothetical protein